MSTDVPEQVDGRRAKRIANRQAVLAAMLDLFREGNYAADTAEVAARAGLSPRSLFRYFDDVHDLHRAAIEQQLELARPYWRVDVHSSDPVPLKIDRLVRTRVRQYEVIAPTARAARHHAARYPLLAGRVAEGRAAWREQIRRIFRPELGELGPSRGAMTLSAAEVLLAFESYDLLRLDQGVSRARAESTLVLGMRALFGVEP